MSELGPSSAELAPISVAILENNPGHYSDLLFNALSITDWVNHIQDIKDDELRAVCEFCTEYNPFIDLAFDELTSGEALPSRFRKLWDLVADENFAVSTLQKYNLHQSDVTALKQEQKRRQRAIAFGHQLDKLVLINETHNRIREIQAKSA